MEVVTSDEDLVGKVLNSLPKSWSTFRQIQRGRDRPLLFPELEGLLLYEEVTRNIEHEQEDSEAALYIRGSIHSRGGSHRGSRGRGVFAGVRGRGYQHPTASAATGRIDMRNIQCHKCRKFGHYARDCPISDLEFKIREMQQQLSKM
jgi:hypothetical protein